MSTTAHTLALDGLSYLGEWSLDTFTQFGVARVPILNRLGRCMTASCQDIYARRPDLFTQRVGVDVPGPESHSVTVTAGSNVVVLDPANPFTTVNLDGATVTVSGVWTDLRQNGNTVTMGNNWQGASGLVPLTAYGDSAILDASVYAGVRGAVYRADGVPLASLPSRDAFLRYNNRWCGDYGRRGRGISVAHHLPSRPEAYWVETQQGAAGAVLRVRFAPLPDQYYAVEFDAKLRAPVITPADFGTDATDPWAVSGRTFGMPAGMDESILEAYFRAYWAQVPWFREEDKMAGIAAARQDAEKKLLAYSVQTQRGSAMHAHGYRRR